MKKLLSLLLAGVMLVSCSSSNSSSNAKEEYGCDVLSVFNTGEYIGEDTISNFEKEYGVTVKYSIFASNEEMLTKLMVSGSDYDVIIPSDYMIGRLIESDMLAKLDKSIITNFSNLYEGVLGQSFDPDNEYSAPYFWGTVGIAYDSTKVSQEDVESQGWEVLRNTKYKGMIYMYDSVRDSFMVALKALGYSMNDDDLSHIDEAYEWLRSINDTMDPAYVTDEIIDGLAYGEKAMGVVYSGDAAYIIDNNENMKYYEPQQGTNKWVDAMVITKTSSCQTLANVFINYMMDYDTAYANSEYVGYASSHAEVLEDLGTGDGYYAENEAYTPRDDYELDEAFVNNEKTREYMSELWLKVKA